EHLGRDLGGGSPVTAAEGVLGHLLAGAEAVEDGAAGEAVLTQPGVDGAAEPGVQVQARRPGGLVDREVGRDGEGQRDTAQAEAVRAVAAKIPGHTLTVAAARRTEDYVPCMLGIVNAPLSGRRA